MDAKPCRCGTGRYCSKHMRYGKVDPTVFSVSEPSAYKKKQGANAQVCGGGRRLIRRSNRTDQY